MLQDKWVQKTATVPMPVPEQAVESSQPCVMDNGNRSAYVLSDNEDGLGSQDKYATVDKHLKSLLSYSQTLSLWVFI